MAAIGLINIASDSSFAAASMGSYRGSCDRSDSFDEGFSSGRKTPLAYMPEGVKDMLLKFLTVASYPYNWKGVAEEFGYTSLDVSAWELNQNKEGADLLLRSLIGHAYTVERFITVLQTIGNEAASKVLIDAYEQICLSHDIDESRRINGLTVTSDSSSQRSQLNPRSGYILEHGGYVNIDGNAYVVENFRPTDHSLDDSNESRPRPTPSQVVPDYSDVTTRRIDSLSFGNNVNSKEKSSGDNLKRNPDNNFGKSLVFKNGSTQGTNQLRILPPRHTIDLGDCERWLKGHPEKRKANHVTKSDETIGSCEEMGGAFGTAVASNQLHHSVSVQSSIQRAPFRQGERRVRVFMTFTCTSKKDRLKVYNVYDCLRKNEFSVSHEESDMRCQATDRLGWLDSRFRQVDYILVLLTPDYIKKVTGSSSPTAEDQNGSPTTFVIDPTDRILNTRYIYKLMQTEYFMNKCVNKRFIPVILPSNKKGEKWGDDIVPNWLRQTLIYHWPDHYKQLLAYMLDLRDVVRRFVNTSPRTDISVTRS